MDNLQMSQSFIDIEKIKENFSDLYLSINELSHKLNTSFSNVGHLNISTITLVCDLNCTICIESLTRNFSSLSYPLCEIKKAKSNKDTVLTKRGKIKKSFYNQTTITYFKFSKKSIKVFTNGKLQITGIISINDALEAIGNVIQILINSENALFASKPLPSIYKLVNFKIEMINSNFKFNKELKLKKLELKLAQKYKVVYEPDTYPGIKLKLKNSSIFIFGTGNVVITGAKKLTEISEMYELVANILNDSSEIYLKDATIKKQKHVNINTEYGYSVREVQCVKLNA